MNIMNASHLPPPSEPRLPLRFLTGFYRRQRRLMVILAVVFSAAAVLAAYSLHDRYTAVTLLLPGQPGAPASDARSGARPSADTEVEIMRSDATHRKVAIILGLAANAKPAPDITGEDNIHPQIIPYADLSAACLREGSQTGAAPIDEADTGVDAQLTSRMTKALKEKIKVRKRNDSDVIAVEATGDTPEEAAALSCIFTRVSLAEQVRSKLQFFEEAERTLEKRVATLRKTVENPAAGGASVEHTASTRKQGKRSGAGGNGSEADAPVVDFFRRSLTRSRLVELNRDAVELNRDAVMPDIRVVAWAVEPDSPGFPPRKLLAGAGVLAGILAAIAVALVVDVNFTGISTARELEIVTGVWNIGLVTGARRRRAWGGGRKCHDLIIDRPSSPFSSTIYNLYYGVDLLLQQRQAPRSILVTSMSEKIPHDVIAVALARSAALCGKKVVIVGGGPQESGLPRLMSLEPPDPVSVPENAVAQGISNQLQTDPNSNLKVLSTKIGGYGWNGGMVHYPVFNGILEQLEQNFDLVVVLAPSLPQADDVFMRAIRTGLRLLLVESGASMTDEVSEAMQKLRQAGQINVVTALVTL